VSGGPVKGSSKRGYKTKGEVLDIQEERDLDVVKKKEERN